MLGWKEEVWRVMEGECVRKRGKAYDGRMSGVPGPTVIGHLPPTRAPTEIDDMLPFEPLVFTVGSEERVACPRPRGLPEPSMWWEYAGVRLPTYGRVYQKGHELVFVSTTESDAGVYTCRAANLAGQRRQDVNITVASKRPGPEGGGEGGAQVSGCGCDGRRLPWCSLLGPLGSAPCGLGVLQLWGGGTGARHRGWVTAHRKMALWLRRTAVEWSLETQVPLRLRRTEGPQVASRPPCWAPLPHETGPVTRLPHGWSDRLVNSIF